MVKMLIQSSLPKSISTALASASDLGKQHSLEFLCDWSCCKENWQKSPNSESCLQDSCRNAMSNEEEESNLFHTGILELSRSRSALSAVVDMFESPAPKRYCYVYKRRRLRGNTAALPSQKKPIESTKGNSSCLFSTSFTENLSTSQQDDLHRVPVFSVVGSSIDPSHDLCSSFSGQHDLQNSTTIPSSQIVKVRNSQSLLKSLPNKRCVVREVTQSPEVPIYNNCKVASESSSHTNESCSSSKPNTGHGSDVMTTKVDTGEHFSSDGVVGESLDEFASARELCISVLKRHGLLACVSPSSACSSLEALAVDDSNISQSCKICGLSESPQKMLICDLCEGAYHVTCSNRKVKRLPVDRWHCQSCSRKKPKVLLGKSSANSFNIMDKHRVRRSHRKEGPISFMLKDNHPYTSEVQIGKDFQAEVPNWAGPISEDDDYFSEPLEMAPAECTSFDGWNSNKLSKVSSISKVGAMPRSDTQKH